VAHLKRSWRLYLIQHHGDRAAERLFRRLRQEAQRQGIDPEIVEAAIDKHYDEMVWKLGTREANERLGEPTPLERYD
jgi:SOS response regulatory protein OraA/RecX